MILSLFRLCAFGSDLRTASLANHNSRFRLIQSGFIRSFRQIMGLDGLDVSKCTDPKRSLRGLGHTIYSVGLVISRLTVTVSRSLGRSGKKGVKETLCHKLFVFSSKGYIIVLLYSVIYDWDGRTSSAGGRTDHSSRFLHVGLFLENSMVLLPTSS
jgi:hypothetical protein